MKRPDSDLIAIVAAPMFNRQIAKAAPLPPDEVEAEARRLANVAVSHARILIAEARKWKV